MPAVVYFVIKYCFVGENLDKYIHVNVTLLLKYIRVDLSIDLLDV